MDGGGKGWKAYEEEGGGGHGEANEGERRKESEEVPVGEQKNGQ